MGNLFLRLCKNYRKFETQTSTDYEAKEKSNHGDAIAFQSRFSSDFNKVFEGMDVNPFQQEDLVKISNVSFVSYHEVQSAM